MDTRRASQEDVDESQVWRGSISPIDPGPVPACPRRCAGQGPARRWRGGGAAAAGVVATRRPPARTCPSPLSPWTASPSPHRGAGVLLPYTGMYPGLSAEQIAALKASGTWYPQKTTANAWQADYNTSESAMDVTWVDWGDSIESVSPRVGYPARLEVTLYKALATPMTAYTMAVLENPSSSSISRARTPPRTRATTRRSRRACRSSSSSTWDRWDRLARRTWPGTHKVGCRR